MDSPSAISVEDFAAYWHQGQMYTDKPYTYHLTCVATKLHALWPDAYTPSLHAICYLHDILEDTLCPPSLLQKALPENVLGAIVTLTKKDDETYEEYLRRVGEDDLAIMVKFADVLSNLEHSVAACDSRRVKKYGKALVILSEYL